MALGLAGLGYFSWSHSQNLLSRNDSLSAQVDELSSALADEQAEVDVPFFYMGELLSSGQFVHAINRQTGDDQAIHDQKDAGIRELVTPELGYDGRIFFIMKDAFASDGNRIHTLTVPESGVGELGTISFNAQLPTETDAIAPSLDGTRVVAAYQPDVVTPGEFDKHLIVWNLLTGEYQIVGRIGANEHFSRRNAFFSSETPHDYRVYWTSLGCVQTQLYQDNPANPEGPRIEKELRTFCLNS